MISTIIERAKDSKFVLIAEIGVNYYDIAKMNISLMEAAKLMVTKLKMLVFMQLNFRLIKPIL